LHGPDFRYMVGTIGVERTPVVPTLLSQGEGKPSLTPMEWGLLVTNSLRADRDLQKGSLPRRQEALKP